MDPDENAASNESPQRFRSRIPAKSGLPRLDELSDADNNARLPPAGMAPPKHKPCGLPEPTAKQRKTLVEQAGEIPQPNPPAPPGSKAAGSSFKSIASNGSRNISSNSSNSSKWASSTTSRNTSGSSSINTFANGTRPGSAQSYQRPQSALAYNRNPFNPSASFSQPTGARKPNATPQEQSAAGNRKAWNPEQHSDTLEKYFAKFQEHLNASTEERSLVQDSLNLYKTKSTSPRSLSDIRGKLQPLLATFQSSSPTTNKLMYGFVNAVNELETIRSNLSESNTNLQADLDRVKGELCLATIQLDEDRRAHTRDMDELDRKHRNNIDDLRDEHRREIEKTRRELQDEIDRIHRVKNENADELEQRMKRQLDGEISRRLDEVQGLQSQLATEKQNANMDAGVRDREMQSVKLEMATINATLEQERMLNTSLKEKIAEAFANTTNLEAQMEAMKAKITFLESDTQQQSEAFAELNAKTQQAIESATEANTKLRAEETLRRKLHNQVQELKGNIRVFCRVRPSLDAPPDETAKIMFPDGSEDAKELTVMGPEQRSAMGNVTTSKNSFSFDRVFDQSSENPKVFEEISQLVQSALDGYNVCIFCYGQTGSGKTFTMSAPEDGMIPLAVRQIYDTAHGLEEKGWKYSMEGSFIEVYNENLSDLLGKADDFDKKKHDIRHTGNKTTVNDVETVPLETAETVQTLLKRATANRSVAATKANERSSRSHSVFILRLVGENSITGEKSEGTLNLVDLAGSERLNQSGATGDRLKETQNINRSLSCLGDVIGALGQGKEGAHIPYRNSKLTYLLQNSLGGNSKTLMFVMISPLQAHLNESLTSLKFATKVHNTHIGTAKKQTKA